jgi:glycosyltransferase involved in cell wall biosynthesis
MPSHDLPRAPTRGRRRISVALVAYHFPPIGGAGVRRAVQLVRRLPEREYDVTVFTGQAAPGYRWTPLERTNVEDAGVRLRRAGGAEPPRSSRWADRRERWLGAPTPWDLWWRDHVVRSLNEQAGAVDIVHAIVAPYSTAEALVRLSTRIDTPLVVDFEDPWAFDEMLVYPTRAHRRLALARMRRLMAVADAVVMNTKEAAQRVMTRFPELAHKVRAVPNAFDAEDFASVPVPWNDDRFRIVHSGSMHTELGLRQRQQPWTRRVTAGSMRDVDFLPRSPVFLLQAIERLQRERPALAAKIELHFAGVLTHADRAALGSHPAVVHGFLSQAEVVSLMRSAQLLFLPMHDLPPGSRATIVPQKTYEYIAAGPPILAAVPDGDCRDMLVSLPHAYLCRPKDVDAMYGILVGLLESHEGMRSAAPDAELLVPWESHRLADDIVRVYEDVLSPGPRSRAASADGRHA